MTQKTRLVPFLAYVVVFHLAWMRYVDGAEPFDYLGLRRHVRSRG